MGKVQNQDLSQFDRFSTEEWRKFLKKGAYRGCNIHKIAKKLEGIRFPELIIDQNEIKLTYNGSKKIKIKLAKLLKNHESWSLSRLVHNIKMYISSDYTKEFNDRIRRFAEEISNSKQKSGFFQALNDFASDQKIDTHSLDQIRSAFNNNQRFIDESTGHKQVQDNLFKLSSIVREKFNDPDLAHRIASKATAIMPLPPDMDFEIMPSEVQGLIFSEVGSTHPLSPMLVSKQISKNIADLNKSQMSDDEVDLEQAGCKTAKEAVQYIINNQLTRANLQGFFDFDDYDLENLSKCTDLEQVSLRSMLFSGDKLVDTLKNFKKLKSLSILEFSQVTSDHMVEILEEHIHLQSLRLGKLDENLAKAISNLSNLQDLEVLGKHNDDLMVEILQNHSNLQGLSLSELSDKVSAAVAGLNNLRHFKLYTYDEVAVAEVLKKHTKLQSLELNNFRYLGSSTLRAINTLSDLQSLSIPFNQTYDMAVHPNIRSFEIKSADSMSFDQLDAIIKKFPNLQKLYFSKYINSSDDSLFTDKDSKIIVKKFPHLQFSRR